MTARSSSAPTPPISTPPGSARPTGAPDSAPPSFLLPYPCREPLRAVRDALAGAGTLPVAEAESARRAALLVVGELLALLGDFARAVDTRSADCRIVASHTREEDAEKRLTGLTFTLAITKGARR